MTPKYIQNANDLVTSQEAIRVGFLKQAVAKGKAAAPYIEQAKAFRKALARVKSINTLSGELPDFKSELVAAAGFSSKGASHISKEELEIVIKKALEVVSTEDDFRTELVDRYLLTKGDTLGGSMRNWIGSSASKQLIQHLFAFLKGKNINIHTNKKGKVQGIQWNSRFLVFDYKPKLIGKNIDAILIKTESLLKVDQEAFNDPARYLACGELKGGIDPAGADEHWKTANTALGRIRTVFGRKTPFLFFIGAAIETSMATEIFKQLKTGRLSHAANLNDERQVKDLVSWLLSL